MTNFHGPDASLSDADVLCVDIALGLVAICILLLLVWPM